MTPEEFYWKDKIQHLDLTEVRLNSLSWVLDCYNRGTIRRRTIKQLIPKGSLENLLVQMEELERYEDCITIKELLDIIYI
jgi:aldehyde:ferredoxin oxidoreductase